MSEVFGYDEAVQLGNQGQASQADGCVALFHKKAIKHPGKSEEAGRPVFFTKDYVKIIVPGDRLSQVDRPVQEADKTRFAAAWEKYQKGHEQVADGTPLDQWPYLDVAMVATLRAMEFRTVENVATAKDSAISQIMGGNKLRDRARQFLAGSAETEKGLRERVRELERHVSGLEGQLAAAKQHIESEISDIEAPAAPETEDVPLAAPEAPVKRKRGRPRKHPA